jgi:hypothetical protein
MTLPPTITQQKDMLVHDLFCPEGTRSCSPVLGKRVYDLCFAANIKTVGQLASMTPDQLRAKSFSEDLLPYIAEKLQPPRAKPPLQAAFSAPSSGAQGRVAAVSVIMSADAATSGYRYGA